MIFGMEEHLDQVRTGRSLSYMVDNFGKYANPDELRRFLVRYELYKKIVGLKGSVIECGARSGTGVMQWYHLSNFLETAPTFRIIYGFDTFAGFPEVSDKDLAAKVGDQSDPCYDDLVRCIEMHNSPVYFCNGHNAVGIKYPWPRVQLVKGDFMETGDMFIANNQHLVVSLLFLDFDLYEPTRKALEVFLPRMPKGSIIAFDEINNPVWPGETRAVMEVLGLHNHKLENFPFEMNVSWITI